MEVTLRESVKRRPFCWKMHFCFLPTKSHSFVSVLLHIFLLLLLLLEFTTIHTYIYAFLTFCFISFYVSVQLSTLLSSLTSLNVLCPCYLSEPRGAQQNQDPSVRPTCLLPQITGIQCNRLLHPFPLSSPLVLFL